VNLSKVQLKSSAELFTALQHALATSGLPPPLLELEVSDGVLADRYLSPEIPHRLRSLGVGLVVDDFGTGTFSLARLQRLPVDALKIDRSLVRGVPGNSRDAAAVSAIIALAQQLGVGVVAEGVETSEQLAFLRARHCEQAQGFLLSEPMSAQALGAWMRGLTPGFGGYDIEGSGPFSA
jgi:EAL domain-containing protein (putative c-di-GMP-specific phosphodiesterase class I)